MSLTRRLPQAPQGLHGPQQPQQSQLQQQPAVDKAAALQRLQDTWMGLRIQYDHIIKPFIVILEPVYRSWSVDDRAKILQWAA